MDSRLVLERETYEMKFQDVVVCNMMKLWMVWSMVLDLVFSLRFWLHEQGEANERDEWRWKGTFDVLILTSWKWMKASWMWMCLLEATSYILQRGQETALTWHATISKTGSWDERDKGTTGGLVDCVSCIANRLTVRFNFYQVNWCCLTNSNLNL
jgi:hypothetical protein